MGQWIDLQARRWHPLFRPGPPHPPGALRGAVIVGQEIFGVNSPSGPSPTAWPPGDFWPSRLIYSPASPRAWTWADSEADVAQGRR